MQTKQMPALLALKSVHPVPTCIQKERASIKWHWKQIFQLPNSVEQEKTLLNSLN